MSTDLHWIDGPWLGQVAISSRPRGGDWLDEEVHSWDQSGVDIVVSLLTKDETVDLRLTRTASLCKAHGLQFITFSIPDRGVPSSRIATLELVRKLDDAMTKGMMVVVHCRQGIGRSALIAACLLVFSGMEPGEAFRRISEARGQPVPETAEQRKWVTDFARALATPVA